MLYGPVMSEKSSIVVTASSAQQLVQGLEREGLIKMLSHLFKQQAAYVHGLNGNCIYYIGAGEQVIWLRVQRGRVARVGPGGGPGTGGGVVRYRMGKLGSRGHG